MSNTSRQQNFLIAANNLLTELSEESEPGFPIVDKSNAYGAVVKVLKELFDTHGNWIGTEFSTQSDYNTQRFNEAMQRLESHASDTVNEWFAQRNEKYGYTLLSPVAYLPDPDFVPVDRDYVESHIWPNRVSQDDVIAIFPCTEKCVDVWFNDNTMYCSMDHYNYRDDEGTWARFDRDYAEKKRWPNRMSMDEISSIEACEFGANPHCTVVKLMNGQEIGSKPYYPYTTEILNGMLHDD